MSKFSQRHIALHLGYFGKNYKGFACQKHMTETIEHHLFQALKKACLITDISTANYSRCGRTDKGVSALGQVITLTVRSQLPYDALPHSSRLAPALSLPLMTAPPIEKQVDIEACSAPVEGSGDDQRVAAQKLAKTSSSNGPTTITKELDYPWILNNLLPRDIFILGWAACPSLSYKARFNTKMRAYRYFFTKREVDVELMREAAAYLIGEHDFRNFCKLDVLNVRNFVRKIDSIKFVLNEKKLRKTDAPSNASREADYEDIYYCEITGNAFLWHQIRCIMAVLFLVGRKLEKPGVVAELLDLEQFPARPIFSFASEQPLVLHESVYTDLSFKYDIKTLQRLYSTLQERKRELETELLLTNNVLDEINSLSVQKKDGDAVPFGSFEGKKEVRCDYGEACYDYPETLKAMQERDRELGAYFSYKKYIPLGKRRRCDSYDNRIKNLTSSQKQKAFDVHGWKL